MKRPSWLISKYLVQAIVPYFAAAWLLTSVILFVQQTGRYADIFFNVSIPKNLIWQFTLALFPNIVAFTCPMALLIGIIVGLSRMQSDSELTAVRAAGVGSVRISLPIIIFGVLLSAFTFFINIEGVPFAAKIIRKIALQTALYKLESPIEPGVFNTEINGYTIYVKDGDVEKGTWKNIFIYNEDAQSKTLRLITSTEGRIDNQGETSELVLEKANVNTISDGGDSRKLVYENLGEFRLAIKTRRSEIIDKIGKSNRTPDELGLGDLANYARSSTGREKTEAEILWQRRIVLSLTPLIFAFLGASIALKFTRGGRGFGLIVALCVLLVHYLLTLFGEQLARTNQISVLTAGLLPVAASLIFSVWFFLSKKFFSNDLTGKIKRRLSTVFTNAEAVKTSSRKFYPGLKTRILDFDIIFNLLKYFLLTTVFLTAIYLIFTAFELWKFAGEIDGGLALLSKYLYYLLPFIYIQLSPTALMVAALATFVVKSRQNEIVSWTAAGQSVYRLLLPCFALMLLIGFFNWQFQEKVLPSANQRQDELRAQIRSRGVLVNKTGRYWMADERRIYSFEFSDENKRNVNPSVKNLSVYEFSADRTKLQAIYKAPQAIWEKNRIKFSSDARKTVWTDGKGNASGGGEVGDLEVGQNVNPFVDYHEKPSHLNSSETEQLAINLDVEAERRTIEVALQKKYATPFLPFVITLFTAPFALSLSRKGKALTVGYSIGIWLLFIGGGSAFEQFGQNDFISPVLAVWSPIVFFTILGAYLLTKVKT
ncbi:MAG: LptF/LptG family permease [Acidobacteria bacterium]|nr:LptF/LptG family permease [Acidobacteriota bacterium]